MTSFTPFLRRAGVFAIVMAAPAVAQDQTIRGLENFSLQPSQPTPTPTPTPAATPVPVPSAPRIVLPTATPNPAPPPPASAVPAPTHVQRRAPSPRATATRRTALVPAAVPTPAATPPEVVPSPVPTPSPLPSPTATPIVAPAPAERGDLTPWLIGGAIAVLGLALGGWLLFRRRALPGDEPDELVPAPEFVPEAQPAPIPGSRGRIAIALRPAKAGVNLLSATVECEITLTNTGDAPAEDIRLDVRMLSAHAGQDSDLAAIQAQPVDRPVVPVFALAPGEEHRVRSVAALPRDAIRSMTAGGRPMFVPLIAVNVVYDAGRTSQAFAIGVERVDSAKLAPFWLDGPPRTFDTVAARPHAPAMER